MTQADPPRALAAVALARDPVRVLGGPSLFLLPGLAALAAGPFAGALGVGLLIAGGIAGGAGLWLLARILSLRLVVEPDHLHLTGIGTDRRYHLARGNLSRMTGSGGGLRVRFGSLGWSVGRATLATGEKVEVIRLGSTPSLLVVPTEAGRVAVAARSERELLAALVAAAGGAQPPPARVAPAAAAAPLPGRPLTGIERTLLEERLVRERRAALYGARDERAAAGMAATIAALAPVDSPAPVAALPAAVALGPPVLPAIQAPLPVAPAAAVAIPLVRRRRPPIPTPRITRPALPLPTLSRARARVLGPLAVTLVAWALALASGATPAADGLDPLAVALLLCGPVAALAVGLANARWPRLAGLGAVSALIAVGLVVRALVG